MISRIKTQAIGSAGRFSFAVLSGFQTFDGDTQEEMNFRSQLMQSHLYATGTSFSKQYLLNISCETPVFSVIVNFFFKKKMLLANYEWSCCSHFQEHYLNV